MIPDTAKKVQSKHYPKLIGAAAPRVRVTYSQTDRMGYAYYANHLVWFEIGRTELLRSLGQSYCEWEDKLGVFLPVAECYCEYKQSARYDDLLRVETRIMALTRAAISFAYEIFRDSDAALIARGTTRHPFVNREGKVVRVADKLLPQCFKTPPELT